MTVYLRMRNLIRILIIVLLSTLVLCVLPVSIGAQTDQTSNAYQEYSNGMNALANQNYLDAIAYFQKGLELNPYYKNCFKGLGQAYYQLENFDESISYFKQAYTLGKEDIETLQWLAKAKIKFNQLEHAEMYIREAVKLDNRNPLSYEIYGDIYIALNKYPEAIIQYSEAYYINPKTVVPLLRIARSYMDKNKYAMANQYLHLARDNDPQNYLVNYEMGNYYYQTGDYENADRHLGLCLQFYPTYQPALRLRSQLYFKQKQWEQAANILQFTTTLDKYNSLLFYQWGIALEKLASSKDALERALQTYIRGINLDKGDEVLRWRCEDAAVLDKRLNPDHYLRQRLADTNERLGDFYFEKNQLEKALLFYKRSIRLYPLDTQTRQKVGDIYRMRGELEHYLLELKIIEDIDPRNKEIRRDIEYYERVVARLPSRAYNLHQYDVAKDLPIYVISNFTEDPNHTIHYDINRTIKDMLLTAMVQKDNLAVELMPDEVITDELGRARSLGGDFIIKGEIQEAVDYVTLIVVITNIDNGIEFKRFSVSHGGNDCYINATMEIADLIAENTPIFGRIIQTWGDECVINLGRLQAMETGTRLYILPDRSTVDYLIQQPSHLDPMTLETKQIGMMEIIDSDEQLAIGKVINPGFIDTINVNQFVYPVE